MPFFNRQGLRKNRFHGFENSYTEVKHFEKTILETFHNLMDAKFQNPSIEIPIRALIAICCHSWCLYFCTSLWTSDPQSLIWPRALSGPNILLFSSSHVVCLFAISMNASITHAVQEMGFMVIKSISWLAVSELL